MQLLLWFFLSLALGITGEPLQVSKADKMLIKQPFLMQEENEV